MIVYPASTLGCPIGKTAITSGPATTKLPRLKGRPVARYKDAYAKDLTTLQFSFDATQFSGWTSFWRAIKNGITPFAVDVLLGGQPPVETTVQATGPWSSTMTVDGRYDVTLAVQVLE